MKNELFSLALQGTLRRKKSSALTFLVLLVSFSCMIVSLCLTGSIEKTNEELYRSLYGAWKHAIALGRDEDAEWLEEQKAAGELETFGTMRNYGTISVELPDARREVLTGFGTMDEEMIQVGRLTLEKGSWPASDREIAMEESSLRALGYDGTLGQEVKFLVYVPFTETKQESIEQSFVLCGVIRDYSNRWILEQNASQRPIVGAVVTEQAAQQLQVLATQAVAARSKEEAAGIQGSEIPQYFVAAKEEDRGRLGGLIGKYLLRTRGDGAGNKASNNVTATGTERNARYNRFYFYIITAVTMLAVLCLYLIRLTAETHRFAVLRSIGMTKRQLAQLVLLETLLLAVPAAALGIPVGTLGTRAALRLVVFSSSVPVYTAIPYRRLALVGLVWCAAVLAARFILYFVAVRVPLTGKLGMQNTKARRTKTLRTGMIALLMAIFGMAVIYTQQEVLQTNVYVTMSQRQAEFFVMRDVRPTEEGDNQIKNGLITEEEAEFFRQMPQMEGVYGTSSTEVGLSFPGMEERTVHLIAGDGATCSDLFALESERQAFLDGECMVLCIPDAQQDTQRPDGGYLLPDGPVTLHLYSDAGEKAAELQTEVAVRAVTTRMIIENFTRIDDGYGAPYSIVCANAALKKLLAGLEPGQHIAPFVTGGEFGYETVYVNVGAYANMTMAQSVVQLYCWKNGLSLLGGGKNTEMEYRQQIVLLYCGGVCVALMLLLLLTGLLSMETEQEKRSFGILRAIGMSRRQIGAQVFGKALGRSLIAAAGGWVLTIGHDVIVSMRATLVGVPGELEGYWANPLEVLRDNLEFMHSRGFDLRLVLLLTAICLLVPLVLSLAAKRRLWKGELEL